MRENTPSPAPIRSPLTSRERRLVAAAALAPVVTAALVLTPIAVTSSSTAGDVVLAAVVYGGLLGLAAGFVTVDRLQARQCPRCGTRNLRRATACEDCAYDLVRRPRWACTERHQVRLASGLCDCGRRLHELDVVRGIGSEIRFMVRTGGWLLGFLLVVGLVLQWMSSR